MEAINTIKPILTAQHMRDGWEKTQNSKLPVKEQHPVLKTLAWSALGGFLGEVAQRAATELYQRAGQIVAQSTTWIPYPVQLTFAFTAAAIAGTVYYKRNKQYEKKVQEIENKTGIYPLVKEAIFDYDSNAVIPDEYLCETNNQFGIERDQFTIIDNQARVNSLEKMLHGIISDYNGNLSQRTFKVHNIGISNELVIAFLNLRKNPSNKDAVEAFLTTNESKGKGGGG